MTQVRLAAVALNQTPLDWEGNFTRIADALDEAAALGATVVSFPELCLSGYGCEDTFLWEETARRAMQSLLALIPLTRGKIVSVGLPLWVTTAEGRRLFNGAALVADGTLLGIALKRNLAADGLHYEPRWFQPWPAGTSAVVQIAGQDVPTGDLLFELGGIRIGYEICEDAWVEERMTRSFARARVGLILGPSASHFAFGKHVIRRELVTQGARTSGAAYVYCNLLGNEAGRAIYDGDCLITKAGGELVVEARRLSFRDSQMAVATVDLPTCSSPVSYRGTGARLVAAGFSYPESPELQIVTEKTPREDSEGHLEKEDAFARAVALGLFDYLRKSRSKGFVVSLSGGADSSAVAVLVRLMVRLSWRQLGEKKFKQRLSVALPAGGENWNEEEVARHLLLTVYQATRNSSEVTASAASDIAGALGTEHHQVNVDEFVDGYTALAEGVTGRALTWQRDDIALQNIQARSRAPGVWMLANIRGALLLATSNRSEVAVGYATMDGDTCGGLAPLGGIDKAFLRKWLVYMETTGLPEWGPIEELRAINVQSPTAELRPQAEGQTDEGDRMPYDVLEFIERAAIVRRFPPAQVLRMVMENFSVEQEAAQEWVERFYRLFAINQWKRERYAPSFHLDEGNLDPRTWCRFPILSAAGKID